MSIKTLGATCLSQDRKNRGNNFAYLHGQEVLPEDECRGRKVINILSRVTSRVAPTRISDVVSVYVERDEIVVNARAQEEDDAGRRAGIVIHAKIPPADDQAFPDSVRAAASQFAEFAGLTLTEQAAGQIAEAVRRNQSTRDWYSGLHQKTGLDGIFESCVCLCYVVRFSTKKNIQQLASGATRQASSTPLLLVGTLLLGGAILLVTHIMSSSQQVPR